MVTFAPQPLSATIEDQLLEAILAPADPSLRTPNSAPGSSLSSHSLQPTAHSLAKRFNLSLRLLLDFLASPTTRARIAAAVELRDLAHHERAQLARDKALGALEHILDTTEDPVEKRRAASAMLRRSGGPALRPGRGSDSRDAAASAKPLRPEPETPSPALSPEQVIQTVIHRLQDNDNPFPGAGLSTLHNFGGLDVPYDDREDHLADYIDDPGEDAALIGASSTLLHPAGPPKLIPSAQYAGINHAIGFFSQRVTLTRPDLTTHDAIFHLHLRADLSDRKFWRIARIEHLNTHEPEPHARDERRLGAANLADPADSARAPPPPVSGAAP